MKATKQQQIDQLRKEMEGNAAAYQANVQLGCIELAKAEEARKTAEAESAALQSRLEAMREAALRDCDALKAEIAGLTAQVAEQHGYIRAMVETEAIANGDLEQAPPPQPAPRVRRQPPSTQPMFVVNSAVDFSQGLSGRVRQSPKMWWQRGPGR